MPFLTYGNQSGNSSVVAYMRKKEAIVIRFKGTTGSIRANTYLYRENRNSEIVIKTMKALGKAGRGLNSFINSNKPIYSEKYFS